jgi:uncharacterized protein (DUF885 family)
VRAVSAIKRAPTLRSKRGRYVSSSRLSRRVNIFKERIAMKPGIELLTLVFRGFVRYLRRAAFLAMIFSIVASASAGTQSDNRAARVAAQNALFEELFQSYLLAHPEQATSFGDYRYNDRLDDRSLAGLRAEHARDQRFLARISAIPMTGFSEQDETSHQVLVWMLSQRISDYNFKEFEMPVNQMDGPQIDLADLPQAVPFDTVKQYEDYVARLRQIPRVFAQTEEVLRAGIRDHLMPVRFLLDEVALQCDGIVAANPFLKPLSTFPATISPEDRSRLTKAINDAVANDVLPAYKEFGEFVRRQYAPHGRTTLAVTSLPGGAGRYLNKIHGMTTMNTLTPDQIHQLGLSEVRRIQAEMLIIAQREGFADVATYQASLANDPQYRPISAEQILADYRKYIAQMQGKMPTLFGNIPESPLTVEALPEFRSADSTQYKPGTPDGSRPGRILVATSQFADRSRLDEEATAYHEGIPGHHMQGSVAQHTAGLPKFRQFFWNSAFGEGWALYAEQLGKEVGFYQEPASDFGRLTSELFRAVRLVVDTGIHAKGWTRDQVVDYMRKTGAADEPSIQFETDRYIAWPAQALSYKLGQLKIIELRARAQRALGSHFDVRRFHDEILSGGVLPLELLDEVTDRWIRAQTIATRSADGRTTNQSSTTSQQ